MFYIQCVHRFLSCIVFYIRFWCTNIVTDINQTLENYLCGAFIEKLVYLNILIVELNICGMYI